MATYTEAKDAVPCVIDEIRKTGAHVKMIDVHEGIRGHFIAVQTMAPAKENIVQVGNVPVVVLNYEHKTPQPAV